MEGAYTSFRLKLYRLSNSLREREDLSLRGRSDDVELDMHVSQAELKEAYDIAQDDEFIIDYLHRRPDDDEEYMLARRRPWEEKSEIP